MAVILRVMSIAITLKDKRETSEILWAQNIEEQISNW